MRMTIMILLMLMVGSLSLARSARAEFIITSAIIEFTADGPSQHDIELVSRSRDNDYIATEISEIINPGTAHEERRVIEDPADAGLLVTPDKTVLTGGSRKLLRFVLLHMPDEKERIFRVAVKPVVKGVEDQNKIGLKILVGYEVLVIVRPRNPQVSFDAKRQGKYLLIENRGNTNVLLQHGQQCNPAPSCKVTPVMRVYPGSYEKIELPADAAVSYTIWDGIKTTERQFD